MIVSSIVSHLRTYCPSLGGRVAISMDFSPERNQVKMLVPCAVVFPDGDDASPSQASETTVQEIEDSFAVVLIVKTADALRGEETADHLHLLRAELFRALLGWKPAKEYGAIAYLGGEMMSMDRHLTYFVARFSSSFVVGSYEGITPGQSPETWQEYELAGLPKLESLGIEVDVIDPIFDSNLKTLGPDGRVEFTVEQENLGETN